MSTLVIRVSWYSFPCRHCQHCLRSFPIQIRRAINARNHKLRNHNQVAIYKHGLLKVYLPRRFPPTLRSISVTRARILFVQGISRMLSLAKPIYTKRHKLNWTCDEFAFSQSHLTALICLPAASAFNVTCLLNKSINSHSHLPLLSSFSHNFCYAIFPSLFPSNSGEMFSSNTGNRYSLNTNIQYPDLLSLPRSEVLKTYCSVLLHQITRSTLSWNNYTWQALYAFVD